MGNFIKYELEEGNVLVEISSTDKKETDNFGVEQQNEITIRDAKEKFIQSFSGVKSAAKAVLREFEDLHVDEAEIKFGLKAIGEAGIFAVGKVGGEVNYEITLKWKKKKEN
ncbi:MAG: hypothetical protein CVU44_02445 [Chloroflexi bacterium HGW-Chloroflexi-6]|nr:MAG: hypothetical protein CVU44_02445 [Chloroflexi bacterium HGW-Chloroflexi-6]